MYGIVAVVTGPELVSDQPATARLREKHFVLIINLLFGLIQLIGCRCVLNSMSDPTDDLYQQ